MNCSCSEDAGNGLVVISAAVILLPVVKAEGSVVTPKRVLSPREMTGPEVELLVNPGKIDSQMETGSLVEVSCSGQESILSELTVLHLGPGGLSSRVPEVVTFEAKSIVKAAPCLQLTDSAAVESNPGLAVLEPTSSLLLLASNKSSGCKETGLMAGTTVDVGSGLVPGLKGYGVSNRLPAEAKTGSRQHRGNAHKRN